jgi:hypothetical protein
MRNILLLLVLSSCVSTGLYGPVKAGKDKWMITNQTYSAEAAREALDAANQHCGEQGKVAEILSTNTTGVGRRATSAQITYTCVSE